MAKDLGISPFKKVKNLALIKELVQSKGFVIGPTVSIPCSVNFYHEHLDWHLIIDVEPDRIARFLVIEHFDDNPPLYAVPLINDYDFFKKTLDIIIN